MEKIIVAFIKWLSTKSGFKIAMIKIEEGKHSIQGDEELLKYVDIVGYVSKKQPLKRTVTKQMKLYTIDFDPMWPVPCGLVILANNEQEALELARETVSHTEVRGVLKVQELDKPKVVFYESGDY